MKRSTTAIISVGVAIALGGAVAIGVHLATRTPWVATLPLSIPSLDAEVLQLDASAITRRGPPRAVAIRLGSTVEFVPAHFSGTDFGGPQPIEVWIERLRAPLVLNAGQFDENLDHLGWLKADDEWISSHLKRRWKGLLVSGPLQGEAWAGIIDLEESSERVVDGYRHVVQSMMLVDAKGRLRVRDTDNSACRTIVGQDRMGRLVILLTEGATTLADLARWLPATGLNLARVMNLDGGLESQFAVDTPEIRMAHYGQYGTGTTAFDGSPGTIRYPLPAVIAVHLVPRHDGR